MPKQMPRNFAGIWIPAKLWLCDELSPLQKVLLVEIDSLDNGKRGCFATNAYFSAFLGVGISQTSRLINDLVGKGFIESYEVKREKKSNERRLYMTQPLSVMFGGVPMDEEYEDGELDELEEILRVRKNAVGVSANMLRGATQKCGGGLRKNAVENKPVNKPMNKPIKLTCENDEKTQELVDLFTDFWKAYPNKKGSKAKAKDKFLKILKSNDATFEVLMNSLAEHKKTQQWVTNNGRFIPMATSWLNGSMWEAEFSESDFIVDDHINQRNHIGRISNNDELDQLLENERLNHASLVNSYPFDETKALRNVN